MNKIEVNPTLFITCRLCLEDLGQYQIVPEVKEQIVYCFDIQVEPFDGLPQLICKKCEVILSNFSSTKKRFIEKQNVLKSNIQGSHNGQLWTNPVVSSENGELESNNPSQRTITKKRIASLSSSSSDLDNDKTFKENEKDILKGTTEPWPGSYTRQYVCRICNLRRLNLKALKAHFNSCHSALKIKYSSIFKRHCEVKLRKSDGKHNVTSSKYKVMHTKEKIVKSVNPKYYILYTKRDEKCNSYESTNSSDDEIVVKRKRTNRLYSRSSNETVVLDSANKSNNLSDNEKESRNSGKRHKSPMPIESVCINIDSSDNESENVHNTAKTDTVKHIYDEDIKIDQSTINDIITSCQNKYIKKHYHDNLLMKPYKTPSDIAIQLKRKILSIGRKIINKKNILNCTPLLRFIEHKNLDIVWFPRSIIYVNQESNYIRIMTRSKNIGENVYNETGWSDYKSTPNQTYGRFISVSSHLSKGDSSVQASLIEPTNVQGIDQPEVPYASFQDISLDTAVLNADPNLITDTMKLLNASPVANPKQLPKKCVPNDLKTMKVVATKQAVSNIEVIPQDHNEYCMPIITSTTSLAIPFEIEEKKNIPKNDKQKSDAPRIKVKPVSELMSVETLSRMQEPVTLPCIVGAPGQKMTLQNENSFMNVFVPQSQNTDQPNNMKMDLLAPNSAGHNEFLILSSVDLPNMTTNSPFQYFKRLLKLHNMVLLDTDVELSGDFHCLIKFKVMYKQDPSVQPVVLSLALYCSKNVFCLKVKDRNQDGINISKITANWQWEILKVFKGEVVNKVLKNARKVGPEVCEFTNSFLCLLNSITLINMS